MHFEFINAPVEGCERFDIIVWNACEQSLILLSSQTLVVNSGYSITDDKYSFLGFWATLMQLVAMNILLVGRLSSRNI